jgi:hypothetical protein
MESMQSVGLREFRANLHKYTLGGKQPLEVTSHGRRIGFFIPASPTVPDASVFERLIENAHAMAAALEEAGVTEDEIVEEFGRVRKEARKANQA